MSAKRQQKGVILVFLVIIIAVLLGIAAFSLDLGRLLTLKTEMQNAVDSAALAAAKELDAQEGATERAKKAALNLIKASSYFAENQDILPSFDSISPNEIEISFYCAIENDFDDKGNLKDEFACGTNVPVGTKVPVSDADDIYAHYVQITLNPNPGKTIEETSQRYKIPLFFLPVLRVMGINTPTEAGTSVRALAGRQYLTCRPAPVMICDPSENGPALQPGQMVKIKRQGGSGTAWSPGDFVYLQPAECTDEIDGSSTCTGNELKAALEKQLANENGLGCHPPYVTAYPGQHTALAQDPINTRFGIGSDETNPSAPNVVDYPRDDAMNENPVAKFGQNRWSVSGDDVEINKAYSNKVPASTLMLYPPALSEIDYMSHYHPLNNYPTTPGAVDYPLAPRYVRYMNELSHGISYLPQIDSTTATASSNLGLPECYSLDSKGKVIDPTKSNVECVNGHGDPRWHYPYDDDEIGDASRRVLYVASLKCSEYNVKGKTKHIYVPSPPAGWKKFFLTEHVQRPSETDYYAEYMGPVSETDGNFEVVIQLYE